MAFTPEKLATLRARYADDPGGRMYDPAYAQVAAKVFSRGARPAPFVGVPTFLTAPFRQVDPGSPDFSGLDVAITGVPMDLGVGNRAGTRFGPRAIRTIERVGPYNHVLKCAPIYDLAVADVGDVPFSGRYGLHRSHAEIEAWIGAMVAQGVVPLSVGGDHSMTHPILRAVGREQPVGLVHIDAHSDTGGPFDGERFNHGAPFRNAVLDGVLDPERTIQIGLRGASGYLYEFAEESGMTMLNAEEVAPQYDATTNTAHAGAQMLFEILSLMVAAIRAPEGA